MKILKIIPFFSERIWGGKEFIKMGFDAPKDKKIGEAWVISAHENGMGYIKEGEYKGKSLKELFENNKSLFDNFKGEYPLLVKIISANDFLSVQVHPNDEYALKKHNSLGKPESWYVLDCPKDAELIYGHSAKSKEEFSQMINDDNWDKLLVKKQINKGDFLYVPPGKVHAITPGVVVYELQRSSDITYRLYDYNRTDDNGNPRELHIDDSIANTKIPDNNGVFIKNASKMIMSSEYFSLYKLDAKKEKKWKCPENTSWLQLTVIGGSGKINDIDFNVSDSAITIDKIEDLNITGDLEILVSWLKK